MSKNKPNNNVVKIDSALKAFQETIKVTTDFSLNDFHQKYEDLVWYARKPGNLKLSPLLTEDLSIMVPAELDHKNKTAKFFTDLVNGEQSAEEAYLKNPDKYNPLPFEIWAIPGEKLSGFSKLWPSGDYHKDLVEGALKHLKEVEKKYPDECAALNPPEKDRNGDWQHGFNSGCLAAIRYALADGDEVAQSLFPELDT